jgi:hypothetical protein
MPIGLKLSPSQAYRPSAIHLGWFLRSQFHSDDNGMKLPPHQFCIPQHSKTAAFVGANFRNYGTIKIVILLLLRFLSATAKQS